jgi:hypothetical protein
MLVVVLVLCLLTFVIYHFSHVSGVKDDCNAKISDQEKNFNKDRIYDLRFNRGN